MRIRKLTVSFLLLSSISIIGCKKVEGPQGPKGIQGEQGIQGPQ